MNLIPLIDNKRMVLAEQLRLAHQSGNSASVVHLISLDNASWARWRATVNAPVLLFFLGGDAKRGKYIKIQGVTSLQFPLRSSMANSGV
jgi:hypothetical protein